MKHRAVWLAWLTMASALQAAEWDVRVEVQMVAIPLAQALPLVPQLRRPETFAAANARLQKLLTAGEAELLGWPIVQMKSGERAMTESVEEVRYGVEDNPPTYPIQIRNGPAEEPGLKAIFRSRHVPPTAFEIRNCGPTLEVTATVDKASRAIELTLTPFLIRLEAMELLIGTRHQAPSMRPWIEPRESLLGPRTALTIPNDGRVLMSSLLLTAPPPRVLLFLLHAAATPSPPAIP